MFKTVKIPKTKAWGLFVLKRVLCWPEGEGGELDRSKQLGGCKHTRMVVHRTVAYRL